MNKKFSLPFLLLLLSCAAWAQPSRWQQRLKTTMDIDMDVQRNQYSGKQKLQYTNNSPDTLRKVYFHLYWNAFQPNSSMDVRSRRQGTITQRRGNNEMRDWDPRVQDRIANLKPDEIGYQRVSAVRMNGRPQQLKLHETVLEVILDRPVLPRTTTTFDMDWTAQVPLQVRRAGRDNPNTKVRYTMTQWYPKMAEYDYEGWHLDPYIAREFYGVWGDYNVNISIDKAYVLGGSGTITNAAQVGYGYEPKGTTVKPPAGEKLTWRFAAPNVHDFAWAADPDYKHIVRQISGGPTINVLYKNNSGRPEEDAQWQAVADAAVTVYPFIKNTFGEYPYLQYSFIHGGDGGMEYPNCTMLAGPGLGTVFHEWMHTWYQMLMATNESLYPWMDEGFTDWATDRVEQYYAEQLDRRRNTDPAVLRKNDSAGRAQMHAGAYNAYFALAKSGREEPMTTHSDHYNTNYAYSNAAYAKGSVFVEQLGYITGAAVRDRIMLEYYRQWRYKHPNPNDLIQVAEKVSGLKLDWYKMYWVGTTKTIDYSIDSLYESGGATNIRLARIGQMPMPVDVKITFKDGSTEWHYVPLDLMYGEKGAEEGQQPRKVYGPWRWTHPTYEIQSARRLTDIVAVDIDPSGRMADVERKNNRLDLKW